MLDKPGLTCLKSEKMGVVIFHILVRLNCRILLL